MTDHDLSRLLDGPSSAEDTPLAAYIATLKAAFPEEPVAEETEAAHLAAMAAVDRTEPAVARSWRPRRRPLRTVCRVAAVSVALFLLFCGLAVAGALPPSIEGPLSRAALKIGVHLPGEKPAPAPIRVEHPSASPSTAPHPDASEKVRPSRSPSAAPQKHKEHRQDQGSSGQNGSGPDESSSASGGGSAGQPGGDDEPPSTSTEQDEDPPADEEEPPEADQDPPEGEDDPPQDPGDGEETDDRGTGSVPDRTGD